MKFTYTQPAGENTKFAPNAFDSSISNDITLNTPSGAQRAVVVSVVVSDDGNSAQITVETEESPFEGSGWVTPQRTAGDLGLTEEDLA